MNKLKPWLIFLLSLTVLASVAVYLRTSMQKPPSVVFIVVDTLRSDHLGCYGYPRDTSPAIDRLAASGVTFTSATAQSSWTLPSMVSMMSGRHLFSKVPRFPDDTPNLAMMMKKRGFQTAGFVANALVGEKEGFHKGFDTYEVRKAKTPQWSARDLNNRLLPFMRNELKPPFFLYIHYLDPHFPYEPPENFAAFDDRYDPLTPEKRQRFEDWLKDHPEFQDRAEDDVEEMRRLIRRYDGEIRFTDLCVGEVLTVLRNAGLDENTVVVLTSDHGECLWDHLQYEKAVEQRYEPGERHLINAFFRDHGYHLFEELIHVPLIVRGPGIEGGRTVDAPVEIVDLIPTLLQLQGESALPSCDGRSLVPGLMEGALPERPAVFSHCNEGTCMIQTSKRLKLVAPNDTGKYFGLDLSLFDLERDPDEWVNRLHESPGLEAEARHMFKAIEEMRKNDYFLNRTGELDEDTRRKMEELGYTF
jgi:arylsulfatase A-like enzyme